MLRSLVLILLLVNAAFFAWSQGWLNDVVGVKPDAQHEPQRLTQQINPDKIVVAQASAASPVEGGSPGQAASPASEPSAPDASAGDTEPVPSAVDEAASGPGNAAVTTTTTTAATTAPAPAQQPAPASSAIAAANAPRNAKAFCIEAGPFSAAEYASAEAMVRPLMPSGFWTRHPVSIQGMWLVYMGPYTEADQLQRKQDELKRIKDLDFEVVRTPANLAQGISLGRFSKRENADNQLEILKGRGIRTARIVNLRPAAELQLIRVPRADVDTQVKLAGLKLPQGKGFTACRS
jgi:cell division septation protein DedD